MNPAVDYFERNIQHGMGDLETMLAGLWFRLHNDGALLDPHKRPPGYRSPRLREYLRETCGANRTTLWGPTAIRGDLAEADKGHIITFLELVNQVSSDQIARTLEACGRMYATKVNNEYGAVVLPALSTAQLRLIDALRTHGTVGKIQQGLVYAALVVEQRQRGGGLRIETKRTHAGDQQSGRPGDILVFSGDLLVTAYEIKALTLTQAGVSRVLPSHGTHDYSLFVLALDFRPRSLQDELNGYQNTFAVSLVDFMLTKLADIQSIAGDSVADVLVEIVDVYNREFCENIENDPTIRITLADDV